MPFPVVDIAVTDFYSQRNLSPRNADDLSWHVSRCWEHSCIVPGFSCSICLSPCFNTNVKNSLIYCEFQLWWHFPSYPSVHRSLVMKLGFCSADNFYHFKAEHLFTSNQRKPLCKRMNKTLLWKTLERGIKFLKPKVFLAGKVLAQLSFNLCELSRYFCWFGWQFFFLGGEISYIYFFSFALLYILHWGKGLRPDWSVAEQLLILLFCDLTPCITL